MPETTPKLVVEQRIRNRIIEYFELVSNEDETREYQSAISRVNVLNEVISQWEDWFQIEGLNNGGYSAPVWSDREIDALGKYHEVWDSVFTEMPESISTVDSYLKSEWWPPIRVTSTESLSVLNERGKLSEEKIEI